MRGDFVFAFHSIEHLFRIGGAIHAYPSRNYRCVKFYRLCTHA